MTLRLPKLIFISIALLFIQACSHPIEIEGEGNVMSASGTRTCLLENFQAGDDVCSKNYAIGAYQETYYPQAKPGWKFDHWVTYCTTATPPTYDCVFDVSAATVQKFWGQTMPPLKAVFTPITPVDTDGDGLSDDVDPCPLNPTNPCALITDNDIVTADGKDWAQPDLFISVSWNQMNAACPGGACIDGAILNGRDMTGWTWAGFGDLAVLFNSYGVDPPLPTLTNGASQQVGSVWAPAWFEGGWRHTYIETASDYLFTAGYLRDNYPSDDSLCLLGAIEDNRGSRSTLPDHAHMNIGASKVQQISYFGMWIFRPLQ